MLRPHAVLNQTYPQRCLSQRPTAPFPPLATDPCTPRAACGRHSVCRTPTATRATLPPPTAPLPSRPTAPPHRAYLTPTAQPHRANLTSRHRIIVPAPKFNNGTGGAVPPAPRFHRRPESHPGPGGAAPHAAVACSAAYSPQEREGRDRARPPPPRRCSRGGTDYYLFISDLDTLQPARAPPPEADTLTADPIPLNAAPDSVQIDATTPSPRALAS